MADSRLSALAAITGANLATGDLVEVTDVSDTSMDATGTSKKTTVSDLFTAFVTLGLVKQKYAAAGTSGCLAATYDRIGAGAVLTAGAATAGTLRLYGIELLQGQVVGSLTWWAGSTAGATLTHSWSVLCDSSRTVLAKSADTTTATWTAGTARTFTGGTFPYTVPATGFYYVGLMIAGTTIPTIEAQVNSGNLSTTGARNATPIAGGNSTAGLSAPSDLGSTAGALTALAQLGYCEIS